jgi:hypothetical protein
MGRPKYQITTEDQPAAFVWIARQKAKFPADAALALKTASSAAALQNIVDRYLTPTQRHRLHTAIRQARHRTRHESICITVDGKTAAQLRQLTEWRGFGESLGSVLQHIVRNCWWDEFAAQKQATEKKIKRMLSDDEMLALKAGQKLDK